MANIVSRTIMWLTWSFIALLAVLMTRFLTVDVSKLNTFSKPFDVFSDVIDTCGCRI